MEYRGVSILAAAALLAACAQPAAPPEPEPPPMVAAPDPVPLPVVTLTDRIREEGWLTRFWEQLNAAQRRRVATRLRQHSPPLATDEAGAAPIWDSLGLPERDALIFGPGLARRRS